MSTSTAERPTVLLERVVTEGPDEPLIQRARAILSGPVQSMGAPIQHFRTRVAPGATRTGVPAEDYHRYRKGLASKCADIVLVAERDGQPKVPLIKRARPPFGGCWWIMGGVVFNYRPIQQFLLWKAHTECGLTSATLEEFLAEHELADDTYSCGNIHVVGCLGEYRTAAEDTEDPERVCDTVNSCYMGIIQGDQEIRYDKDHTNTRWTSLAELADGTCGYWYPEHVARRALSIYRQTRSYTPDPLLELVQSVVAEHRVWDAATSRYREHVEPPGGGQALAEHLVTAIRNRQPEFSFR